MNKNSISKVHAERAIAYIKRNPCSVTKQICSDLHITHAQFQSASPYIKSQCERIRTEWYVKIKKIELE